MSVVVVVAALVVVRGIRGVLIQCTMVLGSKTIGVESHADDSGSSPSAAA